MILSLMEEDYLREQEGLFINEEAHECDWTLESVADFVSPLSNATDIVATQLPPDPGPDYATYYDDDNTNEEDRSGLAGIYVGEEGDWDDPCGSTMRPLGSPDISKCKPSRNRLEIQCNAQKQVTKIYICE
jgi:hypothetical protein